MFVFWGAPSAGIGPFVHWHKIDNTVSTTGLNAYH